MLTKARALRAAAATLLAMETLAGCGHVALLSGLTDSGVRGVDALRQRVRAALLDHNLRSQCELFAPSLIEALGGSIETCTTWLKTGYAPYAPDPQMYLAGGRIEVLGNEAWYRSSSPSSAVPPRDPWESVLVFAAIYSEGKWQIIAAPE